MKKRLFASFLASLMLVVLLVPVAYAEETEAVTEETAAEIEAEHVSFEKSGTCGEGITWKLDGNVLRVTGSGEMKDGCPWEYYKDKVKKAVFSGGITYVGAKSFQECENLIAIDFGDSLHTIGAEAFLGCTALESIHLPDTFRKFEQGAFRDCTALEQIYCDGPMPSFRDSCLWTGTHIAIYTPLNNPWPQTSASELMTNYGGRLEIIPGGNDGYEEAYVEEATPETTEAPTEAPTEPETAPPTEAPTVPTLPPVTVPPTTEPPATLPETEPVETTQEAIVETTEETQPLDVVQEVSNNGWIGMVIIAGVFTFLIVGALIFKISSRRGGKYTD